MSNIAKKHAGADALPANRIHGGIVAHGSGVASAARAAADATLRHQQCQQLLDNLLSGPVEIHEDDAPENTGKVVADKDRRPLLRLLINDAYMVDRYLQETATGHGVGKTTLEKALSDVTQLLMDYYGIDEQGIRHAKAISGRFDIDNAVYGDPLLNTTALDTPQIRKWLGFSAGVNVVKGSDGHAALEVLMHWPNMPSLQQDYVSWQADKHGLMHAVDSGLLEMSDAAQAHGAGFTPTGYGRA